MQGRITKGIGGFYYISIEDKIYECKAKGLFRNQKIKPLVGDFVSIDIIDEEGLKGHIREILPRSNVVLRPAVSNVDIMAIVQSVASPSPKPYLLDKYLINTYKLGLEHIIIWTKADLINDTAEEYIDIYKNIGIKSFILSEYDETDDRIKLMAYLKSKTTALSGVSGVGKSSFINRILCKNYMEVGELSSKIDRGKHTTRHSEIFAIDKDTYIYDTPGFSSIELLDIEAENLEDYYPEISGIEEACKFNKCSHISEPDCRVKEALELGRIAGIRYENYIKIYKELKEKRRY